MFYIFVFGGFRFFPVKVGFEEKKGRSRKGVGTFSDFFWRRLCLVWSDATRWSLRNWLVAERLSSEKQTALGVQLVWCLGVSLMCLRLLYIADVYGTEPSKHAFDTNLTTVQEQKSRRLQYTYGPWLNKIDKILPKSAKTNFKRKANKLWSTGASFVEPNPHITQQQKLTFQWFQVSKFLAIRVAKEPKAFQDHLSGRLLREKLWLVDWGCLWWFKTCVSVMDIGFLIGIFEVSSWGLLNRVDRSWGF